MKTSEAKEIITWLVCTSHLFLFQNSNNDTWTIMQDITQVTQENL